MTAVLLALSFGLAGGYLDLALMLLRKAVLDEDSYFRSGRDFAWTVPLGHALFLMIAGGVVVAVNRLRPGFVSMRAGTWLFATLACWGPLLRLPLYGACTLLLSVALARPISAAVTGLAERPRRLWCASAGLLVVLGALVGVSSVRQAVRESAALAGLPASPAGAPNVVLVVWDTVSAYNLSLHGYRRNTSPNLAWWARRGVRYNWAMAPAPWTFPSHSSFFTGRWPYQLNSLFVRQPCNRRTRPVKSLMRGFGVALLSVTLLGLSGCGADNDSAANQLQAGTGAAPEPTKGKTTDVAPQSSSYDEYAAQQKAGRSDPSKTLDYAKKK
jgi:hypothetical protein